MVFYCIVYVHIFRHKIEIEEIIECARKELSLELQLNSVEEEWVEQVRTFTHMCVCVRACVLEMQQYIDISPYRDTLSQ